MLRITGELFGKRFDQSYSADQVEKLKERMASLLKCSQCDFSISDVAEPILATLDEGTGQLFIFIGSEGDPYEHGGSSGGGGWRGCDGSSSWERGGGSSSWEHGGWGDWHL